MSRNETNKLRDVGMYAERLAELHLFEHGFNVAWPSAADGTDLIAYDKGQTWQIQVKSCHGEQQRIDTRARNIKEQRRKSQEEYKYIDAFIGVNLTNDQFYVMPSWLPLPGQLSVKGMPPITANVLRYPELHCLLDVHTCTKTCKKCEPYLQAMSATDREGLFALIARCLWVAKHSGKRKGRREQ